MTTRFLWHHITLGDNYELAATLVALPCDYFDETNHVALITISDAEGEVGTIILFDGRSQAERPGDPAADRMFAAEEFRLGGHHARQTRARLYLGINGEALLELHGGDDIRRLRLPGDDRFGAPGMNPGRDDGKTTITFWFDDGGIPQADLFHEEYDPRGSLWLHAEGLPALRMSQDGGTAALRLVAPPPDDRMTDPSDPFSDN